MNRFLYALLSRPLHKSNDCAPTPALRHLRPSCHAEPPSCHYAQNDKVVPLSPDASRMRRGLRAALVGIVTALAAGWGWASLGLAQPVSDGIAAIVNSEVITISELQAEMADQTVRLKARYDGTEFTDRLVQKQYEVLNQMIERKLQLQEARAKGIAVSEAEVEKAWEQLNQNSTTPGALLESKASLREELTIRRIMNFEVRQDLMVSPEEIRDYYTERQELFTSPPEYHLRQILLLPDPGESVEEVKARAENLVRQLNEGADFFELAAEFSDGTENLKGGDLGFLKKADLLAPLRAALESLNPGEVSPAIETDLGVHILRLEGTKAGTLQPFEEVKASLENQLYQQKTQQAHEAWLASLKNKAYIEIRF